MMKIINSAYLPGDQNIKNLVSTAVNQKRIVKFAPKGTESFHDAIKQKVDEYFRSNNIDVYANRTMRVKTLVMMSLYFVPYLFIVTGLSSVSPFLFYALWLTMGVGIVGIGTSVMHDSNHGSYSTNDTVNNILGNVLNILGGYSHNWKIQHNILHHTYTNLDGLDEDIEAGFLIRMSPHKPLLGIHRAQHIYCWVLYSIMNLFWVTVKDYRMLFRYNKNGMLRKQKISLGRSLTELTLLKIFYVGYVLVLPIMFSGFAWYHVVFGFIAMQMVAGLSLACIFQPAHVMETSEFPYIPDERKMENNWAVHQLLNTTNFAPRNKFITWFIGGLNYQIEHHLFPHICHVHYPKLSKIVKSVAEKYGLPYNVQPTFRAALYQHGKMLKMLGRSQA